MKPKPERCPYCGSWTLPAQLEHRPGGAIRCGICRSWAALPADDPASLEVTR